MSSSIQGSNSLWNIDFTNPDSVATINKTANMEVEESDFSARGLGFMSYVYAKLENDDMTADSIGGYVVNDASFLQNHTTEDVKTYLEQNGTAFSTTIDWTEFEDILTSEQMGQLKTKYDKTLTILEFCEAMEEIKAIQDTIVIGEDDEPLQEIDSYKLFLSQMSSALDSTINQTAMNSTEATDEFMAFLNDDYYTSTATFSFADYFESMIEDFAFSTNIDITGMLNILDELKAGEQSFGFDAILEQLSNDTLRNLIDFTNSSM